MGPRGPLKNGPWSKPGPPRRRRAPAVNEKLRRTLAAPHVLELHVSEPRGGCGRGNWEWVGGEGNWVWGVGGGELGVGKGIGNWEWGGGKGELGGSGAFRMEMSKKGLQLFISVSLPRWIHLCGELYLINIWHQKLSIPNPW